MKPSQACIDIIESYEGYAVELPNGDCKAYPDPGSVDGRPWTIGKGTTLYRGPGIARYGRTVVQKGDILTRAEAEAEFGLAIIYFARVINLATNKLNQNQFDAAVSFAYNTGSDTPQIRRLKSGALKAFRERMPLYNKGGDGRVMPGLVRRREAEAALWDKPVGESTMKPTWINLVRHTVKEAPEYRAYLMDGGNCLEIKTFKTRADLLKILSDAPTAGNVAVGQEGWHVAPGPVVPEVESGVATLKRTGKRRANGLEILALEFSGERFECVSGQPNAQYFRKPGDPRSVPASMEPIPEGRYRIGDIEWAGGRDNYAASWGPGLGPVWVALPATFADDRSAFGIHLDSNAVTSPGSAGCVVIPNESELKRLVAALRKHDPKVLEVTW